MTSFKKCSLCGGEGYHNAGCSLKYATDNLKYDGIEMFCTAERFQGEPLLDTNIELKIEFCTTWEQRRNLLNELNDVIKKYKI